MVGVFVIAAGVKGERDCSMFVTGDTTAVSRGGFVVDVMAVEEGRKESVGPAGAEDEEVDAVGGLERGKRAEGFGRLRERTLCCWRQSWWWKEGRGGWGWIW